jgi:polyribonucleotide nucleotidyltransferase
MFNIVKVEKEIGGRVLSIETGMMGRQADGAVTVTYGETVVFVAAVTAPPRSEEIDYFPLSVDYRERQCAAGKFPGGFIKREGRPSTKETLTSRMIDRPIRPLFPDGYFNEVQITANVLSADAENDPDVLAMIGASAALHISKIPFIGPTGACRVGRIDGQFVVNPTHEQRELSDLDLLLGGKKEAINMIEVASKQVSEEVVADAVSFAHGILGQVCDLIDQLREKTGKIEKEIPEIIDISGIKKEIYDLVGQKLYQAKQIKGKLDRNAATAVIYEEIKSKYCSENTSEEAKCQPWLLKRAFDSVEEKVVRKLLLEGKRLDGRSYTEVRPLDCKVAVLPRTHGSALFTRGETQALVTVTLGTARDEQIIDGLREEYSQKFMLHYNFPSFSVGEVKPFRGPGRREIGHGALAEKALEQVKPDTEDFAYTIKVVSDVMESNGSSSMATVCGGTMAMMDAGIPILNPVAGISIGLVSDGDKYELLTDIIGDEDHFGDMDFKVAGTTEGITAIQLDIKAEGLPHDIMCKALERARVARLAILKKMAETISEPRKELSQFAPKMISIKIDPELIGKVIGPGGAMIKGIQKETGAVIEIAEDGTIFISASSGDGHLAARDIILGMTTKPVPGTIYKNAEVVSVKDFGAFVEVAPGVEGLCHVSELSDAYVKRVDDVCKVGDIIEVKLILIDDQGRLKLSRKAALADLGKSDKPDSQTPAK